MPVSRGSFAQIRTPVQKSFIGFVTRNRSIGFVSSVRRWTLLCTYLNTEVDRGPDGRRLHFTLTQPFRFTVPPVLWFLVLAASFPFRFINFLTKALSIYVPLVSRTVLLDLALPDTWDYKAPSTAPDFFPQLCNGEWSEKFLRRKILGDFHGVRTCDPWISPWNDRNKPAALPTAPRGLGSMPGTTYLL